jgi:hypothetical protein
MKLKKYLRPTVVGSLLGASGTALFSYHNSYFTKLHSLHDPVYGLKTIKEITDVDSELQSATAVITTRSASQFGKAFYNNITAEGRRSIIAQPYDKQGTGVSVTVVCQDPQGYQYILLMRKLKVRGEVDKGLVEEYDQIGGYTKGAPVEGVKKTITSFSEEEERDAAEDAQAFGLTKEVQLKEATTKKKPQYLTKEELESLKGKVDAFYLKQFEDDNYIGNLNPVQAKQVFEDMEVFKDRDYNSIDTAMREFREETGYNGKVSPEMCQDLGGSSDNYGIDGPTRIHNKVTHYVINLGTFEELPTIYPAGFKGRRDGNSFLPNGSEVGKLEWISVADINLGCLSTNVSSGEKGCQDILSLRKSYIPVLNRIIRALRNEEINQESGGLIPTKDAAFAWTERVTGKRIIAEKTEFGPKANDQHKQVKCFARAIAKTQKERWVEELNKCQNGSDVETIHKR